MPETLTIGAVPYLNARPLTFGLEAESGIRLRLARPSDLAAMLRSGEVVAAMAPSIEYFCMAAEGSERVRASSKAAGGAGGFVALPVAAIGSRGPVGSVRLFGFAAPDKLRRVLLDSASRTSNALARVLVVRRLGSQPHFLLPEEVGTSSRRVDAEIVMGDRALSAERPEAEWELDLGSEWQHWVHLPFVYAFWMARADAPVERLMEVLTAARDRGLAAREAIADAGAAELGIPVETARRYLLEQIRYEFATREQDGLRVFYRMAGEENLAPEGARLRFPRLGQGG